jgi:hypothetical protein
MAGAGRITVRLAAAILVVIVALGGMYAVYNSQSDKVDNLNEKVASLESQLTQAQKQGVTPQSESQTRQTGAAYTSSKGVKLVIYKPFSGAKISSPVAVFGEVPGSWSFEASFPVTLVDGEGKDIAKATATLLGDWMTDDLVPFSAKLIYSGEPSGSGALILDKANPSGLSSNADSFALPIKF